MSTTAAKDDATEFKDKGNTKFKQQLYQDAIKFYMKAEAADPEEAVYSSNLSAAFYETGDYALCFEAICRAAQKISGAKEASPLFSRLAARLAKTLCFGLRAGQITFDSIQRHAEAIQGFSDIAKRTDAAGELVASWADWQRIEKDQERVTAAAAQARSRLSSLPIFKLSTDSSLHFFTLGHDKPMSIVDDWGAHDLDRDPLHLDQLPTTTLSRLAFFFGGVGDARHVYGSIIGIHAAFNRLSKNKKSKFRTHFTLLDIHPTALARDLCMFLLLDELLRKEGSYDQETVIEIKATIFYTFLGVIVPPYCHRRFHALVKNVIERLQQSPPLLPAWIHVNADSIPGILRSLHHWDAGLANKTTKEMLRYHNSWEGPKDILKDALASEAGAGYREMKEQRQKESEEIVSRKTDDQVISFFQPMGRTQGFDPCPGLDKPVTRKLWLDIAREGMVKWLMGELDDEEDDIGSDAGDIFQSEMKWYEKTRTFVPPAVLRKRYDGLNEAWSSIRRSPGKSVPRFSMITNHVNRDWRPNSSLFDAQTKPHIGYPNMENLNMFGSVSLLSQFNRRMTPASKRKSINEDHPSLSVGEIFFDSVVDALKTLQGRMTLEFLQGDLMHELARMRLKADHTRPAHFPRTYMRMWLSNVPDYTHGVLNEAIYAVQSLECEPGSVAGANCMLNKGSWSNGDELCYHYAHLLPHEMPRFLGCKITEIDPWGAIKIERLPTPIPAQSLATQSELHTWLTRVLFSTLAPGFSSTNANARIDYPNNLVVFIDLLIRLHGVGFPEHWLSAFINAILSDTLTTDVAPYLGQFPIPSSERRRCVPRRKVNLEPWHVDLENILAGSWEALPFPISFPLTFARSHEELVQLQVDASPRAFTYASLHMLSRQAPVLGLLLFRGKVGRNSADHLAQNIHQVLEGKLGTDHSVHILTMVDEFDIKTGKIRWRMNQQRFKQMQEEGGWVMAPYRSDARESIVSQPFPSGSWRKM
ncbi:hypothetical protein EIP91_003904 [Steccherinum ochraceum]|uniref:Uncharacterized protein n=1 Tax=Steccherinum ochraceum TaxID=92696 RepID=A0A4R0RC85_9APHY|nr:hypothetical protein EIP91_003904 [Steccherinum ochraceum]